MTIASVISSPSQLTVTYDDGARWTYLASWLRDNIRTGRHNNNGQRTFDINLLEPITIASSELVSGSARVYFGAETAAHTFDEAFLRSFPSSDPGPLASPEPGRILWDSGLQGQLEFADYQDVSNDDSALTSFLTSIHRLGFGLLDNVPTQPGTILDVVSLFGFPRRTNYGDIFEVRVEPNPANLAFTSGEIGMHTDNPYRDPVPGLQLLHCLVNDSDGGESQLVDGFAVAEQIRSEHREAFEVLRSTPVTFRYFEAGSVDLRHRTPLITTTGETVTEVRYNCRSIQAFDLAENEMEPYYEAYRILGRSLHDLAARVDFRLAPGQLMIFDNQRVLHGRSAYHEGARHLQGCYADKDSLQSRLRTLEVTS